MHIPRTGELVYVIELSAIFIVAWVDDETQTVDLIPSTGRAAREEYVPWQKLLPLLHPTLSKSQRPPGLRALSPVSVLS